MGRVHMQAGVMVFSSSNCETRKENDSWQVDANGQKTLVRGILQRLADNQISKTHENTRKLMKNRNE